MSQTQSAALLYSREGTIDYTPVAAVYAGDVVVINSAFPFIAPHDIAANALGCLVTNNIHKAPKDTSVFAVGDPVYWNATGTPVTGTASTGAASSSLTGALFMGVCAVAALTGDSYVITELTAMERTPSNPASTSVAAAGSTQGDAAALPSSGFALVTGANATKGAVILSGTKELKIKNDDVANAVLKVYPPGVLAINGLGTSAAILMAAKTSATFVLQGSIYYTIPLLPS